MTTHDLTLTSHGCIFTFLDLRGKTIRPMTPPNLPLVLCLGNFDGVHLAHTTLLQEGLRLKETHVPQGLCGVFTFFYPTSDYVRSSEGTTLSRRPKGHHLHLTTLKEKLSYFAQMGLDFACLCDFEAIRHLPPHDFLHLLYHDLGTVGVVCGFNFKFGAGGKGDAHLLTSYFSAKPSTYTSVIPAFGIDGEAVSASRIRQMLWSGDAKSAIRHMGRPYALTGVVVHGKHLGRAWGFPTANQYFLPESLIPAHGVYAVLCHTPHGIYPGVANVGSHPTVDDNAPINCETHVIGYNHDLYGQRMKVEFLHHLRGEMKFPNENALRDAIQKDIQTAEQYVAHYLKENG